MFGVARFTRIKYLSRLCLFIYLYYLLRQGLIVLHKLALNSLVAQGSLNSQIILLVCFLSSGLSACIKTPGSFAYLKTAKIFVEN